jgi:hypothetical protein
MPSCQKSSKETLKGFSGYENNHLFPIEYTSSKGFRQMLFNVNDACKKNTEASKTLHGKPPFVKKNQCFFQH